MIKKSFLFLERINSRKEKNIWKQGIKDWQDFLKADKVRGISVGKKSYYDRKLREAQVALLNDKAEFFKRKLPSKEIWRLYSHFKEECCFLDVEVDSFGKVILVGISDYYNSNFFVKGINLNQQRLEKELSKYKLVITFNGSSFDLPKLKKQFHLEVTSPHLDLKPLCVNLGLKGGLKEVEKILNLKRPANLTGNPVELWKTFHASGDREWLELLIEYNKEDIENLKGVTDFVYRKLLDQTSLS
ncbi:MAG: ribonuclease H-like domain-containing protein [Nanoarchaeota archaeon]|nr:ribonuclease H-like domain-containing protein [Nanoarchaeota archaeon]MBU1644532.1 ribonuclease H-like domain-containing protein [Nanoarchaeota archaeon]MBU1977116.1 ribonuclease H-like domain-containing protein [Nanoarchaeota archaeon]